MANDVSVSIKDAVAEAAKEAGVNLNESGGISGGDSREDTSTTEATQVAAAGEGQDETTEETKEPEKTSPIAEGKEPKETKETKEETTTKAEDEDALATAEELAAIDANPALKKVYRGIVRALHSKTSKLADKMKEADIALKLMQTIREHPQDAVRTLAAAIKMKVVDDAPEAAPATVTATAAAEKTLLDEVREEMEPEIGKEAASVLAPVILKAAQKIAGKEIEPVRSKLENTEKEAQKTALKNGIAAFGLSVQEEGGVWDESVEKEMTARIAFVRPAEGTTLPQYLRILYNDYKASVDQTEKTVRQVKRLEQAAANAEPVRPSRPSSGNVQAITPGMNAKEAVALAVAQSRKELSTR